MVPALVALAYARLVLGPAPSKMLLDSLENLVHKIITASGESLVKYVATRPQHLLVTSQEAAVDLCAFGLQF